MFGIGIGELAVIAVVALLVFGPERLPDMARQAGRFIVDMRKVINKARGDLSVSASDLGFTEEDRQLLRELRNPSSTIRKRLLDEGGLGISEDDFSLEDKPARPTKRHSRPDDPGRAVLPATPTAEDTGTPALPEAPVNGASNGAASPNGTSGESVPAQPAGEPQPVQQAPSVPPFDADAT